MRVLICGATGNIGRLTVDKALKAGHEVTAAETIPRADVADFLVKQIDSDRYLHQTPLITK